ncbi:apolipoprotein D-like [Wyeomyia smithii]|uniref:apolipoprotein D-like n=1 Tax=Wyeomyia smithii TaxID=174621 RepID=UPI002467F65D|nr:apolipoprotein D-like [Wyeomyia smithii]
MALIHCFKILVLVCLMVGTSVAQVISLGDCPVHPVVQNFDVAAYLGKWYQISRYDQTFERGGECSIAQYSLNEDGSVLVDNRMLVPPETEFRVEIGQAFLSFPDEEPLQAKLNVTFRGIPPNVSNYWVLDTDYERFAFVWSCSSVRDNIRAEYYWLLSRTVPLPESVKDRVEELTDLYLDRNFIRPTRHDLEDCVN